MKCWGKSVVVAIPFLLVSLFAPAEPVDEPDLVTAQKDLQSDRVNAWLDSFHWWAMESQRRMAMDEPISNTMFIQGHNAFNTLGDDSFRIVGGTPLFPAGPNQILSVEQQFAIGARAVELDVHDMIPLGIEVCLTDNPVSVLEKMLSLLENLGLFDLVGAKGFFDFFGDLLDAFAGLVDDAVDLAVDAFEDLEGLLGDLGDVFGDFFDEVIDFLETLDACGFFALCFPPVATSGVPQICDIPTSFGDTDPFLGTIDGALKVGHVLDPAPAIPVNGSRFFSDYIPIIRNFLRNNSEEILIFDLEDGTNGDKSGLVEQLERLTDNDGNTLVFKPADRLAPPFNGERWPTRREMVELGKRIIIFDSRDNSFGPYTDFDILDENGNVVHTWTYSDWTFKRNGLGNYLEDAVQNYEPGDRVDQRENEHMFFGVTADGIPFAGNEATLIDDLRIMVENNVNLLKLDFLLGADVDSLEAFQFDLPDGAPGERLQEVVWSWAEDDPAVYRRRGDALALNNGRDYVVMLPGQARWQSVDETGFPLQNQSDPAEYCYACVSERAFTNDAGERFYLWRATEGKGPWEDGNQQCQEEYGAVEFFGIDEPVRFVFGGPVNPVRNKDITFARLDTTQPLWLNVNDEDGDGDWLVNFSPAAKVDVQLPDGANGLPEGTILKGALEGVPLYTILDNATGDPLITSSSADGDRFRDTVLSHSWRWDYADPKNQGLLSPPFGSIFSGAVVDSMPDDGVTTITLEVSDGHPGGVDVHEKSITILNVVPEVAMGQVLDETGGAIGDKLPVALEGLALTVDGTFSDAGRFDTHTAAFNWADGTTTVHADLASFTAATNGVGGAASATHAFADAGDYAVKLLVTDDDNGVGEGSVTIEVASAGEAANIAAEILQEIIADDANPEAAALLEDAAALLAGNNDGGASNGAFQHLEGGQYIAGLGQLRDALALIAEAAAIQPGLTSADGFAGAECLLVLAGKSVVVKELAIAETRPGSGAQRLADAETLIAEGDNLRDAGDFAGAVDKYLDAERTILGLTDKDTEEPKGPEVFGLRCGAAPGNSDGTRADVVFLLAAVFLLALSQRRRPGDNG